MGWKITSVVINKPGTVSDEQILKALFENAYTTMPPVTYDECMYPRNHDTVYFGNYNNNLIISTYAGYLIDKMLSPEISQGEKILMELFPDSEMGSFALHSVVNYYGWAIWKGGKDPCQTRRW